MKAFTGIDGGTLLFEHLPCPVIWLNAESRIARLNAAAQRLFAAMRQALPLQAERLPQDIAAAWLEKELSQYALLTDVEYGFEKELRSCQETRSFYVQVKRVRTAACQTAGALVVLLEITAQKRLAQVPQDTHRRLEDLVEDRTAELARANQSLRRYLAECKQSATALQKLSSAVEQTADHVIITDKNGMIEYVNPAFEKLTGFTRKEVIGQTPRIIKSGKMAPDFFRGLWQTILAGQVFRAEFINQKKNGELYYEEKIITPIKDERGRITHFVSTGRDITERKQAEAGRDGWFL